MFFFQNLNTIQRVVALLIPGLTPEILALPPPPTSSTSNPNLPISIPLLAPPPLPIPTLEDEGEDVGGGDREHEAEDGNEEIETISTAACIPFIASTFSHACPTRAPGDSTRMHSVLGTFFTGPISSEVKRKKVEEREKCVCFFLFCISYMYSPSHLFFL